MRNSGIHPALGYTGRDMRDAAENLLPPEWERPSSPLRLAGQVTATGALIDVVAFIAQSQKSGTLVVAAGEVVRAIGFDAGQLVGAASTRVAERVGELLRRAGHVSRDDLDTASYEAAIRGVVIGEVLVADGLVDRETLESTLRHQAEEVLLATLRIDVGAFALFDDLLVTRIPGEARTVVSLLMEATRRSEGMSVFRKTIGTLDNVPVRREETPALPSELVRVYEMCNGERSIGEIAIELGMFEFEIMHAMHRLATTELIDVLEPNVRSTADVFKHANSALIELHRRCDRAKVGAQLRDDLDAFVENARDAVALLGAIGVTASGAFAVDDVLRAVASDRDALIERAVASYVEHAKERARAHLAELHDKETVQPKLVAAV